MRTPSNLVMLSRGLLQPHSHVHRARSAATMAGLPPGMLSPLPSSHQTERRRPTGLQGHRTRPQRWSTPPIAAGSGSGSGRAKALSMSCAGALHLCSVHAKMARGRACTGSSSCRPALTMALPAHVEQGAARAHASVNRIGNCRPEPCRVQEPRHEAVARGQVGRQRGSRRWRRRC